MSYLTARELGFWTCSHTSQLLVKAIDWGRDTKTPRYFWLSVQVRQSCMGLHTGNCMGSVIGCL